MSRGLVILMVVLSVALMALLILPRIKNSSPQPVATNVIAAAPAPAPVQTAASPVVRPTGSIPGKTRPAQIGGGVRSNDVNRVFSIETNSAITNLLADPPAKTLPQLERDYTSTTNRDTRLDVMMDVAEAGNADAVRTLTRLFDAETDPELKVDLLDSLLGIEGFKDEKLIMLTLGVRQGLPQDVRQSAIDGLIDLEDNRSIALLNGLLNDPDPEIRQSAQDAIEILQTPPTQIPKLKP
jgi:hypothetical protein